MIDFGMMETETSRNVSTEPRSQPLSEPAAEEQLIDFGMMTSLPTAVQTMVQTVVHVEPQTAPSITISQTIPVVQQTVTATPVVTHRGVGAAYVAKPEEQWGWDDLRDYVLTQIEKRHGPQPRDSRKEAGIFKSFMTRYPDGKSIAIAKAAFEVQNGMWRSAPISVQRFCKGSDVFFADVIAERV